MIDQGKRSVLGVGVSIVDYDAVVVRVVTAAEARRPLSVTALAVHGVMTGVLNRQQRHRLNHLDVVVPDGQPVRWALNLLHKARLRERVYGPALMLRLCAAAAERRIGIFLFGSTPEVLACLTRGLLAQFPNLQITGSRSSLFRRLSVDEQGLMVEEIRSSGASIVFVGLGCPRQETWAYECRDALSMPVIAVGAAFDFHAGLLAQAPPMMQRLGLEWVFRLVQEPTRLWRRYLLLNPAYLALLFLQVCGVRRFDEGVLPLEEMRYG